MKKLIVLFLVCIAAVQFSACGKEPAVNNTVTPESKQEEQTSSQSSFDPRACAESAVRSYFMQRCNEELADPESVVIHSVKLSHKEYLNDDKDVGEVFYATVDYSAANQFGGKSRSTASYSVKVVNESREATVQEGIF